MDKKDRLYLRSLGQKLSDLVYIGKDGLTDNVVKQIDDNLFSHELIKIKVQQSVLDELDNFASEIENKCDCEVVCVIGSKILVYKYSRNPKLKQHILNK